MNNNKKINLNEIINKELSRKDFLKMAGGAGLAVIGVGSFLNYLTQFNRTPAPRTADATNHGFGSRKFGV
jgi:hypothetical protein